MNTFIVIALSIFLFYAPAGLTDTDVPAVAPATPPETTEPPADATETPPETTEPPAAAPATLPGETGSPAAAPATPPETTEPPADATETPPETAEPPADTPGVSDDTTTGFTTVKNHLVIVRDGIDAGVRQTPGFSISDQGHILIYSGALRTRASYLVSNSRGQVFTAAAIKQDEKTGIMLLKIAEDGHGLTALKFAKTTLQPTAPLYAVDFKPADPDRFMSIAGTVTQLPATGGEYPLIVHNALFKPVSAGAPLLNRCYEAVGVNVLQKKGFRQIDPTEQGSAGSLAPSWLAGFLASTNLSLPVVETECLSLEEETQQQLEQAQREREAALQAERQEAEARARAVAEEAQRKEEALSREKEEAERRLEQAQQEKELALQEKEQALQEKEQALQAERQETEARARAAAEEAQRKEEALSREKEEAERRLEQTQQEKELALQEKEQALQVERQEAEAARQQILLYSSIAGGVLLLGLIFVMRAKRKRLHSVEQEKKEISNALDQAQSELSDASDRDQLRADAPDVFIEGVTPQKERIALKIPGASLVDPGGAVVGRSPSTATFIINHEQISRRHFRLFLVSQQVMIEDMGSTNGTIANGLQVAQGARQPLGNGSRLQLGNLEFTVRIA